MAAKLIPLSGKKRIYLVDGQPLVREWFAHKLNKEPDVAICGEAANISYAMRGITASNPHLAVIDLAFEDGSGFELIEKIVVRCPRTAVLVLSMHDETYYAHRVLRAGAKGYVSKKEPTERIMVALRCILRGKIYVSVREAQRLAGNHAGTSISRKERSITILSDREIEVSAMVGRGIGTRRIAEMLHVSPKTIHAYHARIKDKLDLLDANELLREAICWTEKAAERPARPRQADYRALPGVIDMSPRHLGKR